MKGFYTTTDGKIMEVIDFDEINKMVCVKVSDTENKWYHEPEYSTWTSNEDLYKEELLEGGIPEETILEVPLEEIEKPKRPRKKKE